MLRGVSVLKKMLHSGQIWDQKGAIIKLVQKSMNVKVTIQIYIKELFSTRKDDIRKE